MRLVLTSIIALMTSSAMAADAIAPYVEPPPMTSVQSAHDWSGFYVGGSAGLGGGGNTVDFQNNGFEATVTEGVPFLLTDEPSTWYPFADCFIDGTGFWGGDWTYCGDMGNAFGGLFGGQVGYNFQHDDLVFGIEADAFISNITASGTASWDYDYGGGDFGDTDTALDVSLDAYGTIRGRAGLAFDKFLPYLTGGLAWGNVTTSVESYNSNNLNPDTAISPSSSSETLWGWTVGIGGEYAITENVSLKAEYSYMDLGDSTANFEYDDDAGPLNIRSSNAYHTIKAGLNIGF